MHRRAPFLLAAARPAGPRGIDGDHVVTGIDQRAKRRHGEFGSTEKRELHRGPYRQPSAGELGMRRQWTQVPLDQRPPRSSARDRPPISPPAALAWRSPSDPVQERVVLRLQAAYDRLAARRRNIRRNPACWRGSAWCARPSLPDGPQRALHLGPVGRGKSMLMDLFFADAPVGQETPRALPRVHARSPGAAA